MIVFNADLDNTLIYSYKHDIGNDKFGVELYKGREISFMTSKTYDRLKEVKDNMLIVPTSTRTIEQYNRINLGVGEFKYVLVCNGGILLVDGKMDEEWYRESLEIISASREELKKAEYLLETEERRNFELRFIEDLFFFTKCIDSKTVVNSLRTKLNVALVDVFNNGQKVYVIPKGLNKGKAVSRFRKYVGAACVIAAGDSEFDIPMLKVADYGLVPNGFKEEYKIDFEVREAGTKEIFSEALLSECMKIKLQQ